MLLLRILPSFFGRTSDIPVGFEVSIRFFLPVGIYVSRLRDFPYLSEFSTERL